MCWVTYRNKPKVTLTQVDIPVYKVVRGSKLLPKVDIVYSKFTNFKYELGEEYNTKLGGIVGPTTIIGKDYYTSYGRIVNKGFHSYSHRINNICKTVFTGWEKYDIEFFRSQEEVCQCRRDFYSYDFFLAECHIPAGSVFYLNEFGDYVSDRIVIDKLLDIEETYQVFKSIQEIRKAHNL